jgi:hypothetical protein
MRFIHHPVTHLTIWTQKTRRCRMPDVMDTVTFELNDRESYLVYLFHSSLLL